MEYYIKLVMEGDFPSGIEITTFEVPEFVYNFVNDLLQEIMKKEGRNKRIEELKRVIK